MAFRSVSVNQTAAHPLSVTPPAGIVDGDILVAWSVSDASPNSQTFPAGFVQVTGSPLELSVLDGSELAVAIKVASGESGNYSLAGTANIIGGVAAFSGRDPSTTPHRVSNTKADSGHASPWTITSAAFGSATGLTCDILFIADSDGLGADAVHAQPSGYTLDSDFCSATPFAMQGMFAHKDGVASGETGVLAGTGTLAASSAAWSVFAIALAAGSPSALLPPQLGRTSSYMGSRMGLR